MILFLTYVMLAYAAEVYFGHPVQKRFDRMFGRVLFSDIKQELRIANETPEQRKMRRDHQFTVALLRMQGWA